jgi:hypothetical protein
VVGDLSPSVSAPGVARSRRRWGVAAANFDQQWIWL